MSVSSEHRSRPAAALAQERRPLEFVDALVEDLHPVRVAPRWSTATLLWLGLATTWVAGTLLALGPLRPDVLADLATPRLLLEAVFATGTLVSLAAAGLELAVPGAPRLARLLLPAGLFGAGWIAVVMSGDALAGPAVSMAGKRLHCFLESLAVGTAPAILGLLAARQRAISPGPLAGGLIGMSAGALPAFAMQLACMVDPDHALRFHYPPIFAIGVGTALLAALLRLRD